MLSKFWDFVKKNQADIILVVGVVLVCLLSFAAGYLAAKNQDKTDIRIEEIQNGE